MKPRSASLAGIIGFTGIIALPTWQDIAGIITFFILLGLVILVSWWGCRKVLDRAFLFRMACRFHAAASAVKHYQETYAASVASDQFKRMAG